MIGVRGVWGFRVVINHLVFFFSPVALGPVCREEYRFDQFRAR